jgi:hypothetical protein
MNTKSSRRRSSVALPDWMQPIPNSAPSFPSFNELVEQDRIKPEPVSARRFGLFETLLGGNVQALKADLDQYPDKYQPELAGLLELLLAGAKTLRDLTDQERALLDAAVIDYASSPKPKQPVSVRPRLTTHEEPQTRQRPAEDEPRPGVDVPADLEMPAYWWLR